MRKYQTLSTKEPNLGRATLPLGFDGFIMFSQVLAFMPTGSAAAFRILNAARERNQIIDMSRGHKTRAIVITKSNHVLLTAVSCETLRARVERMIPEEPEKCEVCHK